MSIVWTEPMISSLGKHWRSGKSSTETCRAMLVEFPGVPFTRNAIIGKRMREGFCSEVNKGGEVLVLAKMARKARAAARVSAPMRKAPYSPSAAYIKPARTEPARIPPIPPLPAEDGLLVDLLGLTAGMCKWPYVGQGADGQTAFCARERDGEHAYCEHHRKQATSPFDSRRNRDFMRSVAKFR